MNQNSFQQLVNETESNEFNFVSLSPSLHNEPDQIKRRISASKIKSDKITNHGEYYAITGSSGDVYKTTLNSCSCFDFASRGLPCKHIYRFAIDHGLIEGFPKIKPKQSKIFSEKMDDEICRFRSYFEQGIISAEKYVKILDAIKKGT